MLSALGAPLPPTLSRQEEGETGEEGAAALLLLLLLPGLAGQLPPLLCSSASQLLLSAEQS